MYPGNKAENLTGNPFRRQGSDWTAGIELYASLTDRIEHQALTFHSCPGGMASLINQMRIGTRCKLRGPIGTGKNVVHQRFRRARDRTITAIDGEHPANDEA